jgi:hypothetical protein
MILHTSKHCWRILKRSVFDQGVTVSERDESFPNEYAMHIKNRMGRIYTTFDFEAVIYHKTDLQCFTILHHKVDIVKFWDSWIAPSKRYKLKTLIVSSKRIPDDVQKFIKENQQDPACEVSFTTGPHNFKI